MEVKKLINSGLNDLKSVVALLFKDSHNNPVILTPTQEALVRDYISLKYPEIVVAAYTGYGKTMTLSIAMILAAIIHDGVRIGHISVSGQQTNLAYDYILEFLSRQPLFKPLLPTGKRTLEELRKVMNKSKITIGNSVISIHTANLNQRGRNLLGLHFDIVNRDEDAEIPDEIYNEKIGRMLEESVEDRARGTRKMSVGISTTHHRGHFKKLMEDPNVKKYVIPDKIGLAEGRVTPEFLAKRRKELGDYKYGIWYQCKFPKQEANKFFTDDDIDLLLRKTNFKDYQRGDIKVLGVDVARFGKDDTALTINSLAGGTHYLKLLERFNKKPTTYTAGRIVRLDKKYDFDYIVIDAMGVGAGVVDMLVEHGMSAKIVPFKAGEKPINEGSDEKYADAASEAYDFTLKRIRNGLVYYAENEWIREELEQIEFEFDSRGRMKIAKKGLKYDETANSPDLCDSFVYSFVPFIRKNNRGGFAILNM